MDISESSDVNLYPMEPATALEFQESTVKCVYLLFFLKTKTKTFVRILSFYKINYIFTFVSLYIAVKCRWRCPPLARYVNEHIIRYLRGKTGSEPIISSIFNLPSK